MTASLRRKWESDWERKWEGVRGIVEEEEQWSEKWERYWGSLVRHLGGDDSVMMGEEASDGWDRERGRRKQKERGRTGESNCAVLDTSTENTLASCQSDRLAWLIFSSFQSAFHFASLSSLRMCPDANFLPFLRPLCYMPGPNVNCHISCPEAATWNRKKNSKYSLVDNTSTQLIRNKCICLILHLILGHSNCCSSLAGRASEHFVTTILREKSNDSSGLDVWI